MYNYSTLHMKREVHLKIYKYVMGKKITYVSSLIL